MSYFIDPYDLPGGVDGDFQLLFLLIAYGYILYLGSNLISDGSELLLLVPSLAGIVGSVVLPVLGAVPDGAIVLFSGMGDDAQEELSVGVGALAGSTIMLLTIPWFLATVGGRVNLDPNTGQAIYKYPRGAYGWHKLTPDLSLGETLYKTGVTGGPLIQQGGMLMMITSISYLIIQIPAFFLTGLSDEDVSAAESKWALIGIVSCILLFVWYLWYQWRLSQSDSDQILDLYMKEVRRERIMNGVVSLLGVMQAELKLFGNLTVDGSQTAHQLLVIPDRVQRHLSSLLRPFFDKYDMDSNGKLDQQELWSVFHDLHEHLTLTEMRSHFRQFDKDDTGFIDYNEFVEGVAHFVAKRTPNGGGRGHSLDQAPHVVESEDALDEEHEEMPEDLRDLSPTDQQTQIKIRALWKMTLGTALVLLFSDPMVDVLSAVGDRTGISSFYISFVLAPLASNASELIAAFKYSLKKTSRTILVSFATLQGAACLNNTFCLGVFMFLIYFKSLAWEFNAETVTILAVEIVMALVCLRDTHRVIDSLGVLCLYPLSLALVASLEALGWD